MLPARLGGLRGTPERAGAVFGTAAPRPQAHALGMAAASSLPQRAEPLPSLFSPLFSPPPSKPKKQPGPVRPVGTSPSGWVQEPLFILTTPGQLRGLPAVRGCPIIRAGTPKPSDGEEEGPLGAGAGTAGTACDKCHRTSHALSPPPPPARAHHCSLLSHNENFNALNLGADTFPHPYPESWLCPPLAAPPKKGPEATVSATALRPLSPRSLCRSYRHRLR